MLSELLLLEHLSSSGLFISFTDLMPLANFLRLLCTALVVYPPTGICFEKARAASALSIITCTVSGSGPTPSRPAWLCSLISHPTLSLSVPHTQHVLLQCRTPLFHPYLSGWIHTHTSDTLIPTTSSVKASQLPGKVRLPVAPAGTTSSSFNSTTRAEIFH